jgi:HEPN domain-containing protein
MVKDSLDVKKWIRFAQMDYDDALTLAGRFRPSIEGTCYHCQQSAEKILKAYAIAMTNSRSKSHVLEDLLDDCVPYSADFDDLRDRCLELEPYTSLARYPSNIDITKYHMRQALKNAGVIIEFTKSKLKELGYEYVPEQAK